MAIIGTLDMLSAQVNSDRLKKSIEYLKNTNLDELFARVTTEAPIEIEIDGRQAFAIYQTYETKDISQANMEGHRRYIDIQYIHSGIEQILVAPITRTTKAAEYDEERDLHFPKVADYSSFRLNTGMACILYPDDLHAPCISIDAPTKVEKIVVKVAVE